MDDASIEHIAYALVAFELVVPLAVGGPILFTKAFDKVFAPRSLTDDDDENADADASDATTADGADGATSADAAIDTATTDATGTASDATDTSPRAKPTDATKRRKRGTKKGRRRAAGKPSSARAAPALVPLRCAACGAPVPLRAASFPCPHCEAEVRPPDDYVRALDASRDAAARLARAERLWRASRVTSSPWLLWPARLGIVLFAIVVTLAAVICVGAGWPHMTTGLVGVLAVLQVLIGLVVVSVFADARKKLPKLPARHVFHCDETTEGCRSCGGPTIFPADRLTAVCVYCGFENYRAALGELARHQASDAKDEASKSLVDAISDIEQRLREIGGAVAILGIAEVFYAVIFGGANLWDWIWN